mmetsp:Transcript_92116/g.265802  ORF Transcript_92116/g.265802 Transcript_92116/m.265802 type:complete len:219 (-) Transcript_92116:2151-2807(-)
MPRISSTLQRASSSRDGGTPRRLALPATTAGEAPTPALAKKVPPPAGSEAPSTLAALASTFSLRHLAQHSWARTTYAIGPPADCLEPRRSRWPGSAAAALRGRAAHFGAERGRCDAWDDDFSAAPCISPQAATLGVANSASGDAGICCCCNSANPGLRLSSSSNAPSAETASAAAVEAEAPPACSPEAPCKHPTPATSCCSAGRIITSATQAPRTSGE